MILAQTLDFDHGTAGSELWCGQRDLRPHGREYTDRSLSMYPAPNSLASGSMGSRREDWTGFRVVPTVRVEGLEFRV